MKKENIILKRLTDEGHSAFIVGGAVRDKLMGREPKDIDIASSAYPEEVIAIFEKVVPTGIKFGTVTVMMDGEDFEITTFRKDGNYEDGRRPDSVVYTDSILDDLSRRDFTINSMALDIHGNITDPFNGQEDIEKGVIRAVGNAVDRFNEDALRILRAFRFAARYNFSIEDDTLEAISSTRNGLRNVSAERILTEIAGILLTDNVDSAFTLMQELGVLEIILPEVSAMHKVEQDNPFHVFDVFHHTMKSVESVQKSFELRLAMLLHDAGKVTTKSRLEDKDVFYGHNKVSADIVKAFSERYRLSNALAKKLEELVLWHDIQINAEKKSIRRAKAKLQSSTLEEVLLVKEADIKAQNPEFIDRLSHIEDIRQIMLDVEDDAITVKDLKINGYDLMSLGFKGKSIGDVLEKLLDAVMDNQDVNSRENLLSLAKEITL